MRQAFNFEEEMYLTKDVILTEFYKCSLKNYLNQWMLKKRSQTSSDMVMLVLRCNLLTQRKGILSCLKWPAG